MESGQHDTSLPYEQAAYSFYPTPPSAQVSPSHVDQFLYSPDILSPFPVNPIMQGIAGMSRNHTPSSLQQDLSLSFDFGSATTEFGISSLSPVIEEPEDDTVLISTVFHPGSDPLPDTTLSSSDGVLFYVHSPTLVDACPGVFLLYAFASISDAKFRQDVIFLDAPSVELNIILHALYGNSPAMHSPTFDNLIAAIDRMPTYSISPQNILRPCTPLYDLLLSFAPLLPLELYALGAFHDIPTLSVSVSSHLLSYDLSNITDAMAQRIGAVYLKKLMLLRMDRITALKCILLHAPSLHGETRECTFEHQECRVVRAWTVMCAGLAWDGWPDVSTSKMQAALEPLLGNLTCEVCQETLQDRIKDVVVNWASVKLEHTACAAADLALLARMHGSPWF